MTWVRYEDNVANHPKVATLDDATYRMWREAIEWCARNLTDGIIRAGQLVVVSTRANRTRAAKLVQHGLWHAADTRCDSPRCPPAAGDGWVVHDYWDYQPSRQKVREEQSVKAERQRRWLERKKESRDASLDASHDAPGDASRDGSDGASGDAIIDAAPAPPRPAPKGRAGTSSPLAPAAAQRAARAGDGRARKPETPGQQRPPNGRPDYDAIERAAAQPPADLLAEARAAAAAASRSYRARANRRNGALDELRQLTDPADKENPHG